jgi:hypothetical protein
MMAALEELKAMGLSPTETAVVQIYLAVQNFVRSDASREVNTRFEDWSLTDICRAMKIKVNQ